MEISNLNDNEIKLNTNNIQNKEEIYNGNKIADNINKSKNYRIIRLIDKGTFGKVYKAESIKDGEIVAIKKVLQREGYKNRELSIISELDHINIIKMKDYYFLTSDSNERYLHLVMPYYEKNLSEILKNNELNSCNMSIKDIKCYSYQIMHALNYLKILQICHRDIKPQNVLIDQQLKILKICDFGTAKKMDKNENSLSYICTRYYRAPELIFNTNYYDYPIDMWSSGCVIAEMALNKPLFKASNSTELLIEIIKILGSPNRAIIHSMNPNYKHYKFPLIKCFTFKEIFKEIRNDLPQSFFDFLRDIFIYNPKERIQPIEAMCHPFFDDIRKPNEYSQKLNDIFFNFADIEYKNDSNNIIQTKLIPNWYKVE